MSASAVLAAVLLWALPVAAIVVGGRLARGRRRRLGRSIARLGWLVVTALVVWSIAFFLMRLTPGSPFDDDRGLSSEVKESLERRYGLDRPLGEQYLRGLAGIATFDLGPSLTLRDLSVAEVIASGAAPTFLLGFAALAWMLGLGIPAGLVAALRHRSVLDLGISALVALGLAIPSFVLAGVLMLPLVFGLGLLPAAGLGSASALVLPSFCLAAPFAAQIARLTRAGLLEVLATDWIRTARAKGLPERTVILRHALRSALVPVVVSLGPALAGVLTGSLVIEQMFGIPGIGTHFVQSALARDSTLALGMVLVFTVLVSALNWAADALHALLDPRVGRE